MGKQKEKKPNYEITKEIFDKTIETYFQWKKLNSLCVSIFGRKINIPEVVSESIACYLLGYKRNVDDAGDATDKDSRKIEIKAASVEKDLSSFGPKETFDNCIFLHFFPDEDVIKIYDLKLNFDDMGILKANKTQTVKQIRDEGRRPHLSLIESVIEPKNLKPIMTYNLKERKEIK